MLNEFIPSRAMFVVQGTVPAPLSSALIAMWRMGFGPIIGQALMLITTTGKTHNQPRRALVEYFFVYGKKYVYADPNADWYRDVMADPHLTLQTPLGTERVVARRINEDEVMEIFVTLMNNRPAMAQRILNALHVQAFPDDLVGNIDRLHLLTFDPTDDPTPPPLEVDLKWVPPLVAAAWLLGRFGARRRADEG